MLELLILISYLNISNFADNTYYQKEVSQYSSLSDGFLIVYYLYNGHFLYLEPGKNVEDWSDESFNNNFRTLLAEEIKKSAERSGMTAKEGLVPDIDLNLKMPRGLSYILGEGGHIKVAGFEEINVEVKQNRQTVGEEGSSSSFPQIILKERLKAEIKGTVGEKLHADIDHDSELPEQDNQMKIWYGGGGGRASEMEDDIIQELNLGHIGGVGSEKLFGIATRGKIGSTSFDLSAGKLESNEVAGSDAISTSRRIDTLKEYQYLTDEYFYTGLPHTSDSLIGYGLLVSNTNGVPSTLVEFNGDTIKEPVPFLELVDEVDYGLRYLQSDPPLPYFHILNKSKISQRILAVYLIFADSTGKRDTLGDLTGAKPTVYQLKSMYPDPKDPSWSYQMRNIYPLGTREPSTIEIEIFKEVSVGNNSITNNAEVEYAYLLGITDSNGVVKESQVLREDGRLVFPDPFPFLNLGLGVDTVPEIYRKRKEDLIDKEGQNFGIVITTSSSISGNFVLKSSGEIIEGSEKLMVDGDALERDKDYKINYVTGEVELLENFPRDAEISYTFKYKPFFTFDSKYKAGLNIKATPIEDSKLDFDLSFLSRSDKGELHPTVGKEPSNITLGRVDFSLNKEPELLSKVFGKLPFVDEDSKSHFNIDGSYGFSLPNPATNGESYLDDMEEINLAVDVQLGASSWYYCSQPDSLVNIADLAKLDWFNARYAQSRIFPEYSTVTHSENITNVLELYFQPDNTDNWGGIMRTFGVEQNLSQQNFIEVWVKAEEGEMIFEMGDRMVEDQIRWGRSSRSSPGVADSIIPPNGEWDREDKNRDGERQPEEDTGLDGVKMDDDNWVYDPDNYDDGIDDYFTFEPKSFADSLKKHNKEGNNLLDSEDLNGDFIFETEENSFFRYKIDLSSPEYLAKEGLNGWKVFILPLKDSLFYEKIGDPSFENILYTRVWFRGMEGDTRITIAKINIVGNRWKDKGIRFASNDSLNPSGGYFRIGFRNTLEDADYYEPPVALLKEIGSYTYQKEQSLALKVDSLLANNYCLVENYLKLSAKSSGKGYDFRLYKTLDFYIKYNGDTSDSVGVFLRLLTDSLNYYQFKTFAYQDDWDTVEVVFEKFIDLKINGDTVKGKYSLKGNPSLQNIAFLQLGVINETTETLIGEVLIDDIILKGADSRMGSDIALSVSTNVGDLITDLSYSINRKSSNYKSQLSALRELGDRKVASQGFRITADAGKFLNKAIKCPVSLSVRESYKTPTYRVNSDVTLLPEEAESLANEDHSRDLTVNISRYSASDNWFLKHTIDNLKLNGSYRESKKFNPLVSADTVISTTASASYNLRMPKLSLPVFSDQSSSLLPTNMEFRTSYEYSKSETYDYKDSLYVKRTTPFKKGITRYLGLTYKPIRWIDVDYSISAGNDLREREPFSENFSLRNLGQDASLKEEINATHRSNQFGINNLTVTYRTSFNQNHGIEYSRTLDDSLNVRDVRGVSQQRTVRISDDLRLSPILEKLPLISKFSKNISPVKFSAHYTKNGSFAYLKSKPDYKFRYGFKSLPHDTLFERIEKTDGGYYNEIYSISSGFSSSKINLRADWRFSRSGPDDIQLEYTQTPKETIKFNTFPKYIPKIAFFPEINVPKATFLPEIDVDFPNIHKYIPFLGNYVRRANLSFSISSDSSFTRGIGEKLFSEGQSSFNFSPGLDMDFKNGLGVTVNYQHSSRRFYPDSKLNTRGETNGLRINFNYTLKPSSSGFPLLFFGRIKFDKPVNLSASLNYKKNLGYQTDSQGKENTIANNREINFDLNGSYNFSEMVSGGLSITFRNYLNRNLNNLSTTSYGGRFNVKLNF
jgi:hypothetical protein